MTKFTKVANFIFRGTVVAALGTVVAGIVSGGEVFSKLFEGVKKVEDLAVNSAGLDLSGVIGNAHTVTLVLVLAAILSCVAFKCSGKVTSVLRTVALAGMAGLSAIGTVCMQSADIVVRNMNGAASAAEVELVKPLLDVFAKQGSAGSMCAGTFTMAGMVLSVVIAAGLAVLALTSIVSVVKTVKADTCAA